MYFEMMKCCAVTVKVFMLHGKPERDRVVRLVDSAEKQAIISCSETDKKQMQFVPKMFYFAFGLIHLISPIHCG